MSTPSPASGASPAGKASTVQVRWSDEDAFGHVNNAVFLTYAETGRDAMLVSVLGDASVDQLVLARIEIDFRAEVTYRDGAVLVTSRLVERGRSSARTRETITRRDGSVVAELRTVVVARDPVSHGSRPWTDAEAAALDEAIAATAATDSAAADPA